MSKPKIRYAHAATMSLKDNPWDAACCALQINDRVKFVHDTTSVIYLVSAIDRERGLVAVGPFSGWHQAFPVEAFTKVSP